MYQQWRSEVDVKREVFHALEDELQKAKAISDQMFKTHKERDLDFDWHKEKADQLTERWQNVHAQIENRLVLLLCFQKLQSETFLLVRVGLPYAGPGVLAECPNVNFRCFQVLSFRRSQPSCTA